MLTILIGAFALFMIIGMASEGNWAGVKTVVVILVLLIAASSAEREEYKARYNREKFWAHYYDKDR